MQENNKSAKKFYEERGFELVEKLEGYYTDLDPAGCYVFMKQIETGEEAKV